MIHLSPTSRLRTALKVRARRRLLNRWELIYQYPELSGFWRLMDSSPERILPVEMRLVDRILSLTGQVDVDLNSPLSAEDE
jgi:hypothetical protein